jgi:hypothetical protein
MTAGLNSDEASSNKRVFLKMFPLKHLIPGRCCHSPKGAPTAPDCFPLEAAFFRGRTRGHCLTLLDLQIRSRAPGEGAAPPHSALWAAYGGSWLRKGLAVRRNKHADYII